jgi:hypothetical protein
MQDARGPTDSEDEASDPPRRASLRLRDAEAVATVRRDMFGDGSLLDALAGSQPGPQRTGSPPDATASAQPAAPSAPEGDAAAGQGEAPRQADPAEAASQRGPGLIANVEQSLDAIIDSFPVEPAAGAPQQPVEEGAEARIAAAPAHASPALGATSQMGISSLFDSLGSIEQGVDAQPVEEPPAPSGPPLGLDMSMLEVRVPTRPEALQSESDPAAAASPIGARPLSVIPEPEAHEVQMADVRTEVQAGEVDLDMSMLEVRPPARPVLQPDSGEGDSSSARDGELQADRIQAGEAETDGRRVVEPVLARVIDASVEPDAFAQHAGEPPLGDVGGSSQADFSDPLQDTNALSPIERLAMPAVGDLTSPHGFPEPQVLPADTEPVDAEAKIAAEAQATADALDNLRGLLAPGTPAGQEPIELPGHDPALDPGHTPSHAHLRLNLHGDPTPFPPSGPAALMPMPVSPEGNGIRGIYVLGFLTGLGLSLMAGIALYVLINMV